MHRLATLALLATLVAAGSLSAAERPNVVLILVDDLGWTDFGCFGSDLYETPHVDRLAAEGTRFTNAYSACTVCSPTRAAVMTGKYPARLHVTDWIHGHNRPAAKLLPPDWTHFLPLEEVTIAELLKEAGYATCHVGKWHLGDEGKWPSEQGFDRNVGGYDRGAPPSYFSPYRIPTLQDGPEGEYLTDRESAEACGFIAEQAQAGKPFFVYLPHYCVHTPLQGKAEVVAKYEAKIAANDTRHRNATYAAMVESVDDSVGRIVKQLADSGVADETLIVITSDDGGLETNNRPSTDNAPLRAGKGSTYEGGVRVPMIVKWPGVTKPGSVCDEPVISCDFLPTILEVAGLADAKPPHVDGSSLVRMLRDPAAKLDREALYWHYPHYHPGGATPYSAVRARDWKLSEFFEDDHVELYHLSEDIGETKDLAKTMPERAAEMREWLRMYRQSIGAQLPVANPKYDPKNEKAAGPRKRNAA